MQTDKYSAVWVSHSSIGDFLKCPRAYYLNNIYKDPRTNHKICLIQPPLALGQIIHGVIESLSVLPSEQRFGSSLFDLYDEMWETVSGKKGGFRDPEEEEVYKERGRQMLQKVVDNPGPLANKAIKIRQELPHYWLSEEQGIILCGKIDWLEYLPENDSVHIIDFKTGKYEEDGSLQLPIYYLLVKNTQKRAVAKASYWYLAKDSAPVEVELPDEQHAYERVMEAARLIAVARKLNTFECRKGSGGCYACSPFERIVRGEGEYVGESEYKQDIYILP